MKSAPGTSEGITVEGHVVLSQGMVVVMLIVEAGIVEMMVENVVTTFCELICCVRVKVGKEEQDWAIFYLAMK